MTTSGQSYTTRFIFWYISTTGIVHISHKNHDPHHHIQQLPYSHLQTDSSALDVELGNNPDHHLFQKAVSRRLIQIITPMTFQNDAK
jgi:hypothetical protein